MIGKLERVHLRDVWQNESYDLTKWLQENLDVIDAVTGLKFTSATSEQFAGSLSVLLVAKESTGKTLVIENQIDQSDDDHLGKLITHLSLFGANGAVWIVAEPKPEHIRAISWLNESSDADFFLVKLEAVRIGTSEPAPILTKIVGPNYGVHKTETNDQELFEDSAEDEVLRQQFWTELVEQCAAQLPFFASAAPSEARWIGARPYRNAAFQYQFWVYPEKMVVQLRIDDGSRNSKFDQRVFEYLVENQEQIEKTFGDDLEWCRVDGKGAYTIGKQVDGGGYRDSVTRWREIQTEAIQVMNLLELALQSYLAKASPVAVGGAT